MKSAPVLVSVHCPCGYVNSGVLIAGAKWEHMAGKAVCPKCGTTVSQTEHSMVEEKRVSADDLRPVTRKVLVVASSTAMPEELAARIRKYEDKER